MRPTPYDRAQPLPILAVLIGLVWMAPAGQAAPDDVAPAPTSLRIERAEVSTPEARSAPSPSEWRAVALPDRWAGDADSTPPERVYRLSVESDADSPTLYGVLIEDVAMNAEVRWNGVVIGDGGRFDPPIAQNFHTPLYFRVPESLVQRGPNEVTVRVRSAPHFFGWLGRVEIGPDHVVAPHFEAAYFARHTVPEATTVLGIIVALLAGAFWLASREPMYAFFAATVACSTFADLNLHVRDIPWSTMAWARAVQWAVAVAPVPFAFFAHRLAATPHPRTERALTVWGGVVTLLALLVPARYFMTSFTALHVPTLLIGLYALVLIAIHLWRTRRGDLAIFGIAAGVLFVIGVHDTSIQMGGREGAPRYLSALGAPVFFLSFGSLVTLQFVRAFRRVERQNEELEARVAEKHAELEVQFDRLRELERAEVLSDERARIMRDMHDGLGGRLVETLSIVEHGGAPAAEVAAALRAALDDMRLLIDSIDPLVESLPVLLASIRERLEPSLRRGGIELAWEVERIPDVGRFGPGDFLQILRIAQEALTNVLKHSGAAAVTVRARTEQSEVVVEIEDDGCGLAPQPVAGRGLTNMRRRAATLGGALVVGPGRAGGTVVALRIPT